MTTKEEDPFDTKPPIKQENIKSEELAAFLEDAKHNIAKTEEVVKNEKKEEESDIWSSEFPAEVKFRFFLRTRST